MLVCAIPGIHYRYFQVARHKIRGPRRRVSHHKAIRLHRIQIVGRVQQGFAFFQARRFRLKIHCVCAKARSRGAEAQARSRGILKERQDDSFASQCRQFLEWVALDFLERFRLVENKSNFFCAERFDREQIAEAVVHIDSRKKLRRLSERGREPRPRLKFILLGEASQRKNFPLSALVDTVHKHNALFLIDLFQAYLNDLRFAGLHGAPNVLRLDGHLSMAAID
jgi:hypothetical protein